MEPAPEVFEQLRAHLAQHHVTYRVVEHAPAGSALDYQRTLGTRLEQQAKALLVRFHTVTGKGHAVVALQAQKRADLDRVAQLLGAREARLADKDTLRRLTGCGFGELPPLGKPFGLPLLLDRDLLAEPEVYFNAGRLDRSIALDPKGLLAADEPVLF